MFYNVSLSPYVAVMLSVTDWKVAASELVAVVELDLCDIHCTTHNSGPHNLLHTATSQN